MNARSVLAAAIDGATGEVFRQKLVPASEIVIERVDTLPRPVAVTYEAGPAGFGLARAMASAGIRCEVASALEADPSGRRSGQDDARDAMLLARLLRRDEIVAVRVPTITQERARDLVRAREDAHGDLMLTRHRVSKLLLSHGRVYYGGAEWTGKREQWLRSIRFDQSGTRIAYEADLEAVELTVA